MYPEANKTDVYAMFSASFCSYSGNRTCTHRESWAECQIILRDVIVWVEENFLKFCSEVKCRQFIIPRTVIFFFFFFNHFLLLGWNISEFCQKLHLKKKKCFQKCCLDFKPEWLPYPFRLNSRGVIVFLVCTSLIESSFSVSKQLENTVFSISWPWGQLISAQPHTLIIN